MILKFSCVRHPRYRAKRVPQGNPPCTACEMLWHYAKGEMTARQTLMAVFHLLRVAPAHSGK